MGKPSQVQRRGAGSVYKSRISQRKFRPEFRNQDNLERNGYIRGVVKRIFHETGRHTPLAEVEFLNKHLAGSTKEHMIAVEGMYTGQYV